MDCEVVFERFKFNCAQYPEKPAIFICRLTAACFDITEQEVVNAVGLVHAMNAARGQWEKNDPPNSPKPQYDESVIKARNPV